MDLTLRTSGAIYRRESDSKMSVKIPSKVDWVKVSGDGQEIDIRQTFISRGMGTNSQVQRHPPGSPVGSFF